MDIVVVVVVVVLVVVPVVRMAPKFKQLQISGL